MFGFRYIDLYKFNSNVYFFLFYFVLYGNSNFYIFGVERYMGRDYFKIRFVSFFLSFVLVEVDGSYVFSLAVYGA